MALAARIKQILDANRIAHRVFQHAHVSDLGRAAQLLSIQPEQMVCAQVLADDLGKLLVVYPLTTQLDIKKLEIVLKRKFKVLSETKTNQIFNDCDAGCWPPFGRIYGLETIIDSSIKNFNQVYFSSGSYTALVQVAGQDFIFLNSRARFINIVTPTSQRGLPDPTSQVDTTLTERKNLIAALAFPELPSVASRLLGLATQDKHSVRDLIELVSHDADLQQQILLYAQLPFIDGKIDQSTPSVDSIVEHVLGFDMVSHIALGVAAGRAFSNQPAAAPVEFWRHAFYAAAYAERITKLVPDQLQLNPALSYLAGLFHNFGLLLISQLYPPEYGLLKKWLQMYPKQSIAVLEKRLLGMGRAFDIVRGGHAKLGESLLRYWQMPESVCVITREHHTPTYSGEYAAYVKIIQIANQLLREEGIGDGTSTGLSAQQLAVLGLTEEQVRNAIEDLQTDSSNLEQMARSLSDKG